MDIKENNNKESEKSNNILESNFNEEDYINENNNQVRYTELNENFDDNPLGFSEYKDSRISSIKPNIQKNNNNNNNNNLNNNNKTLNEKNSYLPSSKKKEKKIKITPLKIILIGESSVGKTSIIKRYIDNKFNNDCKSTISASIEKKLYRIDNDNILELNIWDTAGEEKYRTVTKQFYKDSHGALIIYDITKKETFEKINSWLNELRELSPPDIIVFIIGNKNDLNQKREINFNETKIFSENNHISFYEVSAKNGNNVDAVFQVLSNKIFEKMKEEENNENKYLRRGERGSIEINKKNFNKKINNNNKKEYCC